MEFTKEELTFLATVLGNSQVMVSQSKSVFTLLEKINKILGESEPKPEEVKTDTVTVPEEVKDLPKSDENAPLVID